MEFKYFSNYEKLASLSPTEVTCEICSQEKNCFDGVLDGDDEFEIICVDCLASKELYKYYAYTNTGDHTSLLLQLKDKFPQKTEEELSEIAEELTKEVEQATPQLITWQDMKWPCLDGDFAQFIAYGSKQFFNNYSKDSDGKILFERSLHPELKKYYRGEEWELVVPDEAVNTFEESKDRSSSVYVFKSCVSDSLIVWWDCM